jgi:hypothetical protein
MYRTFAIGTLTALTLSTATLAADLPSVKSIDVDVELEAIENPAAAAYWTTIADDLENAIAKLVTEQIADDGVELKIDLQEVELSGGFDEAMNLAETRLVGDVAMVHATDNSRFGAYTLTVDINAAMPMFPEGIDLAALPADTRVYYDTMIQTFAQGVVDRLK